MVKLLRASVLIAALLAIPVLPFLLFGGRIETLIASWLSPPPSPSAVFWVVVLVLSTDIFLPVPSSLVSTLAGVELAVPLATLASWLGLTAGATLGFFVARRFGRPLAIRLAGPEEMVRMDNLCERLGPRVLVLFRALPVLAEASVLLMGSTKLSWRRFFVPVALANLGIAGAYAVLGRIGQTEQITLYVLVASIALPLLATTILRWRWPVENNEPTAAN
jgi:uncharacterized membrane protein YdjX (TVP38/TMEM64 family)